jgi:hypothetical protein
LRLNINRGGAGKGEKSGWDSGAAVETPGVLFIHCHPRK